MEEARVCPLTGRTPVGLRTACARSRGAGAGAPLCTTMLLLLLPLLCICCQCCWPLSVLLVTAVEFNPIVNQLSVVSCHSSIETAFARTHYSLLKATYTAHSAAREVTAQSHHSTSQHTHTPHSNASTYDTVQCTAIGPPASQRPAEHASLWDSQS